MRAPIILAVVLTGLSACAGTAPGGTDRAALEIGRVELQAGGGTAALRVAQDLASAHPDDPASLILLGEANAAVGRRALAEAAFARALSLDSSSNEAALGLARLHLQSDPAGALRELARLVGRKGHDPRFLTDLGVAQDLNNQPAQAQASYRAALALDPRSVSAQVDLGLSLAVSGHAVDALGILEPLAREPDATPRVRQDCAVAAALAGHADAAEALLGRDLTPADAHAALDAYEALADARP